MFHNRVNIFLALSGIGSATVGTGGDWSPYF